MHASRKSGLNEWQLTRFTDYINTSEIPSELSRENFISSHVKITCYLHTWRDHRRYGYIINHAFHDLVFHWCLYNKKNITCSLMGMNFIVSCSTRYWFDHSKIKFISISFLNAIKSTSSQYVVFIRKQSDTWTLSCSSWYLTSKRSERVRYRVECSKRNSVRPCIILY